MKWIISRWGKKNPDKQFKKVMEKIEKDIEKLDNSTYIKRASFAPKNRKPPTRKSVLSKLYSSEEDLNKLDLSEFKSTVLENDIELGEVDVGIISEKMSTGPPDPNPSPETLSVTDIGADQIKEPDEIIELENKINGTHPTSIPEAEVQTKIDEKGPTIVPEISDIPEKVELLIKEPTLEEPNVHEFKNKAETEKLSSESAIITNIEEKGPKISSLDLKKKMMGKTIAVLTDMPHRRRSHSVTSPLRNDEKRAKRIFSYCEINDKENTNKDQKETDFLKNKLPEIQAKKSRVFGTSGCENKSILSTDHDTKIKEQLVNSGRPETKESVKLDEVKQIKPIEANVSSKPSISFASSNTKTLDPLVSYVFPVKNFAKPSSKAFSSPDNLFKPPISCIFPGQTTIEAAMSSDSKVVEHIKPPASVLCDTKKFEKPSISSKSQTTELKKPYVNNASLTQKSDKPSERAFGADKKLLKPSATSVPPNTKISEPLISYAAPSLKINKSCTNPETSAEKTIDSNVIYNSSTTEYVKPSVSHVFQTKFVGKPSESALGADKMFFKPSVISFPQNKKTENPLISCVAPAEKIIDPSISCEASAKKIVDPKISHAVRIPKFGKPQASDLGSTKTTVNPSANFILPNQRIVKPPISSVAESQKNPEPLIKVGSPAQESVKSQIRNTDHGKKFDEPSISPVISDKKVFKGNSLSSRISMFESKREIESINSERIRPTTIEPTSIAGSKIDQDLDLDKRK